MNNFIDAYCKYMHAVETPHIYDRWAALWCLSVAAGRGVVVNRPRIPVHLNLYCILMDESGVTRKSTEVRMATKLVESCCPDTHFVTTRIGSTEEFEWTIHRLSADKGQAKVAISASELVILLGKRAGTTSLPGVLVDLYDCPGHYRSPGTGQRGEVVFKDVYVSLFAACSPSWLTGSIHPDVLDGGFTSRLICVAGDKRKKKIAWPMDNEQSADNYLAMQEFLSDVQYRATLINEIEVAREARDYYIRWYKRRKDSTDVYRRTFEAREDDHVLRVAGLLAINDCWWVIGKHHLREAIKLVSAAKDSGAAIFTGDDGMLLVASIGRLRGILLQSNTPLTQAFIYRKMRKDMNKDTLDTVLAAMHEYGLVKRFMHKEAKRGRPATLWQADKSLRKVASVEDIVTYLES